MKSHEVDYQVFGDDLQFVEFNLARELSADGTGSRGREELGYLAVDVLSVEIHTGGAVAYLSEDLERPLHGIVHEHSRCCHFIHLLRAELAPRA